MSSTSRHLEKRRRRRAAERPPYDERVPPWARRTGWHLDGVTYVARRARVTMLAVVVAVGAGSAAVMAVLSRLG